jgi:hypothetical protein
MAVTRRVQAVDAVLYGCAVTVAVSLVGVVLVALLALVAEGTLSRVRWLYGLQWVLFVFGFLTMGLGSWKLRPRAAWKDDSRLALEDSRRSTAFQRAVQRVPPLHRHDIDPDDRLSDGAKLLVASVVMLATVFLLGMVQARLA